MKRDGRGPSQHVRLRPHARATSETDEHMQFGGPYSPLTEFRGMRLLEDAWRQQSPRHRFLSCACAGAFCAQSTATAFAILVAVQSKKNVDVMCHSKYIARTTTHFQLFDCRQHRLKSIDPTKPASSGFTEFCALNLALPIWQSGAEMSHLWKRYLSLFFVLLVAASSLAQTFRGTVSGAVVDAQGAAIANADIQLTNPATATTLRAKSNASGRL